MFSGCVSHIASIHISYFSLIADLGSGVSHLVLICNEQSCALFMFHSSMLCISAADAEPLN
jgi:hypothetical protein